LAVSGDFTFRTDNVPDTAAPVISGVTSSNMTTNSVSITWSTDEDSNSQVEYGLSTSYSRLSNLVSSLTKTHSINLADLQSGKTYHYRVKSRDGAANLAASGDFTFATLDTPDTTAPVISGVTSSNVTMNSATITWSTDEEIGRASCRDRASSYGVVSNLVSILMKKNLINLARLQSGKTYHYRVKSRDGAANLAVSADFTFATLDTPDTTAPVISGVTSSNVTMNSAAITWSTDEDSDSQVEYGLATSYAGVSNLVSSLIKSHSVNLTGLSSGQTYSYRVKSKDAAGNQAVSSNFTFATAADTTAPGDVQHFTAVPGNGQVTLSWTNPADSDFKGVM